MEVVGKIRYSKLCSDWILEGLAQSDASTTEEQAGRLFFLDGDGPTGKQNPTTSDATCRLISWPGIQTGYTLQAGGQHNSLIWWREEIWMVNAFRIDTAVAINVCLGRLEALPPCQKLGMYGSCETGREFVHFFDDWLMLTWLSVNYFACIYIITCNYRSSGDDVEDAEDVSSW